MRNEGDRPGTAGNVGSGARTRALVRITLTAGTVLLLATVAVTLGGCGTAQPTGALTAVADAATSTPEMPAATRPATKTPVPTPTQPAADTPSPLPPAATPARTSTPPPTVTAVPSTATPRPTNTPVPPSATPSPTRAPQGTGTQVPPTRTAVPATDTAGPPKPTPPPATHTPAPPQFPWRSKVVGTFSNCALTRLMGLTLDRNGGIAGDIWVRFWADGWEGGWAQSSWVSNEGYAGLDDSSNWDGVLATHAKPGTWHVCVVPAQGSWDCISPTVTAETVANPCVPDSGGVQIVRIVFQQH